MSEDNYTGGNTHYTFKLAKSHVNLNVSTLVVNSNASIRW